METILCNRKSTKNKWISTVIGKHYRNLHGKMRYGSKRSYGSSLYDCPCCCNGLTQWKKNKTKCTRYDSHIQQIEGYADKDIFIDSNIKTTHPYIDDTNDDYIGQWQCSQCTYINFNTSFCSICIKPFDYNYQNNQNNFHYNDEHPLLIQYKPNKIVFRKRKNMKKFKKKKHVNGNITPKQITATETQSRASYITEAVNYRLNNNHKNGKIKRKTKNAELKEEYFESVNIEISVVSAIYNEYEYIEHKLFDNLKQDEFWMDVPMQLINTKLQQCSIKIIPKNTQIQNTKLLYFEPLIKDFFIPIYQTKYSFIFQHNSIPQILQNRNLFRMIQHCLGQCSITNVNLNRNIFTNAFNLYPILFQYIPAMDILANVLFPLIGYTQAISIKTKVKNAQIIKRKFIAQKNNEWNPIDNKYKSTLQHIIYKNQKRKPKIQPIGNQQDDSEAPIHKLFSDDDSNCSDLVPQWFKCLNGYPDDDTDSDSPMQKHVYNTAGKNMEIDNILFKAPYRFCRKSNLLDDDPNRDKNWWKDVKYNKRVPRCQYNLNDKVQVLQWSFHWNDAIVVQVTKIGITVKFISNGSHGREEFISNRQYHKVKLISAANEEKGKNIYDKNIERKRKAYSKSNRNYFVLNGR